MEVLQTESEKGKFRSLSPIESTAPKATGLHKCTCNATQKLRKERVLAVEGRAKNEKTRHYHGSPADVVIGRKQLLPSARNKM